MTPIYAPHLLSRPTPLDQAGNTLERKFARLHPDTYNAYDQLYHTHIRTIQVRMIPWYRCIFWMKALGEDIF